MCLQDEGLSGTAERRSNLLLALTRVSLTGEIANNISNNLLLVNRTFDSQRPQDDYDDHHHHHYLHQQNRNHEGSDDNDRHHQLIRQLRAPLVARDGRLLAGATAFARLRGRVHAPEVAATGVALSNKESYSDLRLFEYLKNCLSTGRRRALEFCKRNKHFTWTRELIFKWPTGKQRQNILHEGRNLGGAQSKVTTIGSDTNRSGYQASRFVVAAAAVAVVAMAVAGGQMLRNGPIYRYHEEDEEDDEEDKDDGEKDEDNNDEGNESLISMGYNRTMILSAHTQSNDNASTARASGRRHHDNRTNHHNHRQERGNLSSFTVQRTAKTTTTNIINHKKKANEKLLCALQQTKLLNFLLLIGHIALLIKTQRDFNSGNSGVSRTPSQWAPQLLEAPFKESRSAAELQNFQSKVLPHVDSPHNCGRSHVDAAAATECQSASSPSPVSWPPRQPPKLMTSNNGMPATSGSNGSEVSADKFPIALNSAAVYFDGALNICHYLFLAVTLVDLLSNIIWFQHTAVLAAQQAEKINTGRWPKVKLSHALTATRPVCFLRLSLKHLFAAVHLSILLAILGPLVDTHLQGVASIIVLHNCLNRTIKHALNICRVNLCLVRLIREHINDEEQYRGINGSRELCQLEWQMIENTDEVQKPNHLWHHELHLGSFLLRSFFKLEQLLLISEILALKVVIFVVLIHMDTVWQLSYSLGDLILVTFLFCSLLIMHSQYDKYHSRYLQSGNHE